MYKGLALAANNGNNFLYATDFHNNKIDVFDTNFTKVTMPGGFKDPAVPAGFAPFGIQLIGSNLFVTYAQQDAAKHDDVAGTGLGMVDVFDTGGNLKQHFATGQNFSYSLEDIGRYYRDYVDLMAHFDSVLPGRVHRVVYEEVIEDLEGQVRRLLEY